MEAYMALFVATAKIIEGVVNTPARAGEKKRKVEDVGMVLAEEEEGTVSEED